VSEIFEDSLTDFYSCLKFKLKKMAIKVEMLMFH